MGKRRRIFDPQPGQARRTGGYPQSDCARVGRIHNGSRAHPSEKGGKDGQRAVIARFDQLRRKKARIAEQLDPCRRQDDGGAELTIKAL